MSVAVPGFASSALFEQMAAGIAADPSISTKLKAVIQFDIKKGDQVGSWVVDTKSTPAKCVAGKASGKTDLVLTIEDADFVALSEGKLNAQKAFMGGKLKLKGNIALAQKLEVITKAAKKNLPVATKAANASESVTVAGFASSALFEQMAAAIKADPSVVDKVKGVMQFDLKDAAGKEQSWYADLKTKPGSVKLGKAPKADVTLALKDSDFVAMSEGKLNAQNAFMKGQLKIKGNMMLAQKLELITKKK
eukprot:TRINITY_DN843_c0_g1_i2.p1 TRINITY_DN843_c0_g1~~TRINITY_DN843_c0_g1_i2.p1  ORF type:complete len:249 (-),score=73.20 TRINITY_DN843_c0_g1_i2:1097-1843(-)